MRKSKYNSFDELPLMLTVEDVSHVLGIGLAHAYEVAHRRDFSLDEEVKNFEGDKYIMLRVHKLDLTREKHGA